MNFLLTASSLQCGRFYTVTAVVLLLRLLHLVVRAVTVSAHFSFECDILVYAIAMRRVQHGFSLTPPPVRTRVRLGVSSCSEVERLLTPQELAPIRAVFANVDRDGDGWLTAHDLQRSAIADGIIPPHDPRAREKVKEWLWEVDDDGDGRLSFSDFAMLYGRIRKGMRKGEPHRLCNYLIFKLIDVDRDGVLKIDEIYSYLCHILEKEMANYNMSRVLGASVDSPETAKISPAAWMRVLESSLWENMSPVLDTGRNLDARHPSQRRHRESKGSAGAKNGSRLPPPG